jgi:Mlc titration factor MtfA (ptsG expression regulator)
LAIPQSSNLWNTLAEGISTETIWTASHRKKLQGQPFISFIYLWRYREFTLTSALPRATLPALFALVILEIGSHFLPWSAWTEILLFILG